MKLNFNVAKLNEKYNFIIEKATTTNKLDNNSIIFISKNFNKHSEKLKGIKESVIILKGNFPNTKELEKENLVIRCKNPRLKYAELLFEIIGENFLKDNYKKKSDYFIGENVIFGKNVYVEPNVTIGSGTRIGNNVIIKSGVKIGKNVVIGNDCYLKENSTIGNQGFGLEQNEEGKFIRILHLGGVIVGDDVEIGSNTTICSGTINPTIISERVQIDDHVHVAHNCSIGKGSILTAGVVLSGSVSIGSDCWLAPNATVINGITIGNEVKVGLAARITKNLDDKVTVMNEDAIPIKENIKRKKMWKEIERKKNEEHMANK